MLFENSYLFFFSCFLAQHFLELFDRYRLGIVVSLLPGRPKLLNIVADFLILNTLNTGLGVCPPGIIHDRLHHGLTRNIVQCLQDFDIPLYLSHTIVDIQGDTRVEKAIVAKVDENRRPIPGTEMEFDVDTILLSVGLIPENELTRQAGIPMDPHTKGAVVYENMETGIPGVFACGNVVHVHDLVDFVSGESDRAGAAAAAYVLHGETPDAAVLDLVPGNGVGYTVPQRVRPADVDKGVEISFRVRQNYGPSQITITCGEKQLARFKRQRMAPGEMEHITLPGVLLAKADGPLTVAVEEVVAK